MLLCRARLRGQRATAPRRKNTHDAKHDIEQRQRVRNKPPHPAHPSDRTEHARAAVRAPTDGRRRQEIAKHGVHGDQDPDKTGQNERQEAISQDAGGPREGQG